MHTAELEVDCGDRATAQAVWAAVRLEVGGLEGDRAQGTVHGHALHVTLQADDLSGLRASLTSAARLCDAALKVIRVADGEGARDSTNA